MDNLNALPPGYRLQEYEVVRVLGVGGFGITYLCFDHNLDQARAIKEYLPNDLAIRMGDNTVRWKATEAKDDFEAGLKSFLDEARRLARFKHDNIVNVHRSFSELGTAYIVMEYAEGETLASILDQKGTLTEKELKRILLPILNGLEEVHKVLIHRDIKPGNIIIRDVDDSPVLLDFGSARQAAGSKSKSMTAIVTAGFAPMEQYSTQGNQGPWTDVYALGCLCYRALTGEPPKEAPLRIRNDPVVPVSVVCKGKVDPGFLQAIDWALKVYEEERPQSVHAWREAILGGKIAESAASSVTKLAAKDGLGRDLENKGGGKKVSADLPSKRGPAVLIAAVVLMLVVAAYVIPLIQSRVSNDSGESIVESPLVPRDEASVTPVDTTPDPAEPGPTEPETTEPETAVAVVPDIPVVERAETIPPAIEQEPVVTEVIANVVPFPDVRRVGTVFRDQLADGTLGPIMVTVPAGQFRMGNSQGNGEADEEPAHEVYLSAAFAMAKYEVTFADYDKYANATGVALPFDGGFGRGAQPLINISWYDAVAYAAWLSAQTGEVYRLPSEAEWEYAGRAGSTSGYPWGGSVGEAMANCRGCASVSSNAPTPVGAFPPNAFGINDLQGNVWEWVQDCARDSYEGAPADGSVWIGDEICSRVLRGGSWSSSPNQLRSSYRNWYPPVEADDTVGFRLVREIE